MEMNQNDVALFAKQKLLCGESPLWDETESALYWTDCINGEVYRKGLKDAAPVRILHNYPIAGIALHQQGGLIFGGKDGFYYWSGTEAPVLKCNSCDNQPLTDINDIIADPKGRVFGGQEAFREDQDYKHGYLFRLDPRGKCQIVEEGLHLGNGMGFSPGLDSFYLVDTILREIYVYDYNVETGAIKNRKTLIRLSRNEGLPDGLTVDQEGYIWIAQWFGGAISRYDPEGKLERTLPLPIGQPTSLTFGGIDYQTIFVTSADNDWKTPLAPEDYDYTRVRGGSVYKINQSIKGKPEFKANI